MRFGFLKSMLAALFCLGALDLAATAAFALITVDPGTYEVPALLASGENGPVAIFNWNTRSQCRILLTGQLARSLQLKKPKAELIKIFVTQKIEGMDGSAELVGVHALRKRKPPRFVLNNLKPAPDERR